MGDTILTNFLSGSHRPRIFSNVEDPKWAGRSYLYDRRCFGSCKTPQEHDQRLVAVLDRLRKTKVTLNKEKCEFSKYSVRFLGQIINQSGICPDQKR